MLSNKPYLIRAFYEWIVDSQCTPHLVVNANFPRCKLPKDFIESDGRITLNVSPSAIRDFKVTSEAIEFRASFSGVVHIIYAPIKAVLAIYAAENEQGMFFDYEEDEMEGEGAEWPTKSSLSEQSIDNNTDKKQRASHLRLVE